MNRNKWAAIVISTCIFLCLALADIYFIVAGGPGASYAASALALTFIALAVPATLLYVGLLLENLWNLPVKLKTTVPKAKVIK